MDSTNVLAQILASFIESTAVDNLHGNRTALIAIPFLRPLLQGNNDIHDSIVITLVGTFTTFGKNKNT